MIKYLVHLKTFLGILLRRLREQGLLVTIQWLYAVGVPYVTGHVPLRYSRVTPQLYLGAQHGRRGIARLRNEGIEAVVNLRDESDDADTDLLLTDYCYVPVVDNTAPTLENLEQGVEFIQKVIDADDRVYVHCHSGVGRAPTMVAAYLISQGDSVEEAVDKIRSARPFIRILPDQLDRLYEYHASFQKSNVVVR